ncbi:MAG: signal recognition particle receptor subunit alpha, partial [Anaerolineales bacterium]|nr:signal recognition particle receptor subunit alpha [Anaerolineales bacterium]
MDVNRWHQALSRTRRTAFNRLASMLGATELSNTFWQELEETLIQADLGISTSIPLINELKQISHSEGLTTGDQVFQQLRTLLIEHLKSVSE